MQTCLYQILKENLISGLLPLHQNVLAEWDIQVRTWCLVCTKVHSTFLGSKFTGLFNDFAEYKLEQVFFFLSPCATFDWVICFSFTKAI